MDIDKDTKELIQGRLSSLKSGKAKAFFAQDASFPALQQRRDAAMIEGKVRQYEEVLAKIEEMVKALKQEIPHIVDQTLICACYLILGKVINACKAIVILARHGNNQEFVELVRSAQESCALVLLFCLDDKTDRLSSWFEGKIIEHANFRDLMDGLFAKSDIHPSIKEGIDHKKMSTDIYRVMSKYTHCSYAAILDSVDVFTEDFDFEKRAGFHYVLENEYMLKSLLGNMIVSMKALYIKLGKEKEYAAADQLHIDFMGERTEQDLIDLLKKAQQT